MKGIVLYRKAGKSGSRMGQGEGAQISERAFHRRMLLLLMIRSSSFTPVFGSFHYLLNHFTHFFCDGLC